jgi:hypothetical protein
MTERRPIYSGQATGQPIGYIEDDQAFDLFDRPCATYEGDTGLLRDPKNQVVVGYVSLSYIFVGSSWMAQELFCKPGPITPQASLEELECEDSDAAVCGADDGNAENVDTVQFIAQAPPSHHTAKVDLSVVSTPMHLEMAAMEEHAPHATDITTFPSSSEQDNVLDTVLAPPASPILEDASTEQPDPQDASDVSVEKHAPQAIDMTTMASSSQEDQAVGTTLLTDSSTEQPARLQDASDAGNGLASGEAGSDDPSHTMGEAAPALRPDAEANATMPVPCDESAFEIAEPDVPSGGAGMPPPVEAFMRHLAEYFNSQNHQAAMLSSALEPKLSASTEAQKDTDRVLFSGEPYFQVESSGCASHSGLTGVDPEQTEDCFSVRTERPVKIGLDKHREGNSVAAEVVETHGATRGFFLTERDSSAEQPSTGIAETVALVERFAPLSGDGDLHPRATSEAVPDNDNRLSAGRSELGPSLEAATSGHQVGHVVRDRMATPSADGQAELPKKTLSASYYRHRAQVLRVALITTRRPEAAVRLRAFIEKYRALADRAAGLHRPG